MFRLEADFLEYGSIRETRHVVAFNQCLWGPRFVPLGEFQPALHEGPTPSSISFQFALIQDLDKTKVAKVCVGVHHRSVDRMGIVDEAKTKKALEAVSREELLLDACKTGIVRPTGPSSSRPA